MILRYTVKALAAFAIILSTDACSNRQTPVETIYAVSIEPQRWLLQQLADTSATVVTVLPTGSNPENFDPPMSLRAKIEKAEAYFATGALPFEDTFRKAGDTPFFDTSEGIERIYGTHDHFHSDEEHDHGESDPHFWTSVSGARQMAANMTKALKEIDPAHAADYDARLETVSMRLDSIDTVVRTALSAAPAHSFAVWHPSLSYFARDYNLHQLSVGQESKEMSARQLKDIIDHASADSIRVFFFQRQYDARQARTISDAIGSRMVTIDPLAFDWDRQIIQIADELAKP